MSAFKKRGAVQKVPIGAKVSSHNSEYIISSGVQSLDALLGNGGVAVHSLVTVKCDVHTKYARLMLKYFISQGLCSQNPVLFISTDDDLLNELPVAVADNIGNSGILYNAYWRFC
jgi:elongator complex protein 4